MDVRWSEENERAAAAQGWCLCTTDGYCQVMRWDNAQAASWAFGMPVPQLNDDAEAMDAMRAAYEAGEHHAMVAYGIISKANPREFRAWMMHTWRVREAA